MAGKFGQDAGNGRTVIRQKIGQSDLAAMTGIACESASRNIDDWQRCKIIRTYLKIASEYGSAINVE
jgi:hypothetical protein